MHSCCSDSGFEVRDDAGAGLHVDFSVLHHRRAEHDAGVHRPVGGEIADAARIRPALLLFELVDDLHRANLRRAGDCAGRKARDERIERVPVGAELPHDVRHDVHHVAVVLEEELVGHLHRADRGDAAGVVPAKIEEHQVLGALLRVGEKLLAERLVLLRRLAARPGSGDRADRHFAFAHADQDFRARADDREAVEVEEIEKRRGVHPAKRAVKGERGKRKRRLEALRQHHLKDVAGGDVFLRARDHRLVFGRRRVRGDFARKRDVRRLRRVIDRLVERVDHIDQPVDGAVVGGARRDAGLGPDRSDDGQLVLHRVEDRDDARADQHGIGNTHGLRPRHWAALP